MKKFLHLLLLTPACLYAYAVTAHAASGKAYTVAVIPQLAATQTFSDWTPFLAQLSVETGFQFNLKIYKDNGSFVKDLEQGVHDLALLNPYQMLMAKQKQGYRPLLRDRSNLVGILVSKVDSGINKVEDLKGQKIAFPSPHAFAASIYLRALLTDKLHINYTPEYLIGHQNVYRHVLLGEVAAGGGITKTLDRESDEIRSRLKVVYSTAEVASHPLVAHPGVPHAVTEKIIRAILAMPDNPESAQLLKAVQLPAPVRADFQRDYSALAKLKLERHTIAPE